MVEISKTILSTEPINWQPLPTGEWYSLFLGANRQWGIVDPMGRIARDSFLSKANADQEVHVRRQASPISTLSGR
jgi:hypothetical protein